MKRKRKPPTAVVPIAYRPNEAARAIGVSSGHIRNLMKDGSLPFTRLGRAILIRPEDLLALLDESKRERVNTSHLKDDGE